MTIIYCIFLYYMAIRIFIRNHTRKNYFCAISIVSVLMLATDITTIIAVGILDYFLYYQGWQLLVAYVLGLIWTFWGSISLRKIKFNSKFKVKDQFIKTSKGRVTTYAILTALMLGASAIFIVLFINNVVWVTPVVFVSPLVIAIFSVILLIRNLIKSKEEFVLVTWIDDKINTYIKKIETGKFNYKQFVGELSKLYFIYEIGTIIISGDVNKTQFAYMLKLNELEDFNFSELGLVLDNSINPQIYAELYNKKQNKAKIIIKDNKIESIK